MKGISLVLCDAQFNAIQLIAPPIITITIVFIAGVIAQKWLDLSMDNDRKAPNPHFKKKINGQHKPFEGDKAPK